MGSMKKDIFIKFMQGNCTEPEFNQFREWVDQESQSISGRQMIREVWDEFVPNEKSESEKLKYDQILDKIHHQIHINQNKQQLEASDKKASYRIGVILTRAAAVLLIPVLSLLLYTMYAGKANFSNNLNMLEVEAPAGSRIHIRLGDGTLVWLNHGSKLKYPYRFSREIRKVYLEGEAYFQVAHNAKIPFVVGTSSVDVKATGTEFNVSAYPDDKNVVTTLVEGKVILYNSANKQEIKALLPDQCLKYNSEGNTFVLESGETEKNIGWKDGRLIFRNDSFGEIAKKLDRWFNVEVEITSEKVNEFTCTATFTDETLSQVLELLTIAAPVNYALPPQNKMPDGSFSRQKVVIGLKTTN